LKVAFRFRVAASATAARRAALGAAGVAPHVAGRTVRKFVYVPGKISMARIPICLVLQYIT